MRIVVHDYAGHPFQIQLSRWLAERGYEVVHCYCGSLRTTPQSDMTRRSDDAPSFTIRAITLDETLDKVSLFKRRGQEKEYGRRLCRLVKETRPDVVISANTPLDAQARLIRLCRNEHIKCVYWAQDLLGVATLRLLRKKIPLVGTLVGQYYARLERTLLRSSDSTVIIADDFVDLLESWGVDRQRIHIVENWAPIEEFPLRPRDNPWARANELVGRKCFLYSGTLGMKHDPALLLRLARDFAPDPEIRVVVISQGTGADWLMRKKEELDLQNLVLLPFQPYGDLPDVMATADVLVGILEADAGYFSVPSKVLSYLCASRPLLLSVPGENLVSRIVKKTEAGVVVNAGDAEAFSRAGARLMAQPALRERLAANGRRYAEETFAIDTIGHSFENILIGARQEA